MQYEWVSGSRFEVDGQIAGEALDTIRETNGGILKPQIVVDESRPKSAPLHRCFEWNDARAANEHRKDEAAKLIRSVRVITDDQEADDLTTVRAFVHVELEGAGSCYMAMSHVMENEELREQVIREALAFLQRAKSKLKELHGFENAHSAIEEAERALPLVPAKRARSLRPLPLNTENRKVTSK